MIPPFLRKHSISELVNIYSNDGLVKPIELDVTMRYRADLSRNAATAS